jgi:hypothetical protein
MRTYFRLTADIQEQVDVDVSVSELLRQMKNWNEEELRDFASSVNEVLAEKKIGGVTTTISLHNQLVTELLLSISDRISISESEEIVRGVKQ